VRAGATAAAGAVALGVTLSARAEGAYGTRAWGPLGLGLVAAVAFLAAYGLRASRWLAVAGSALVAVGLWAVVSVVWGGLPQVAWTALDRSAIAVTALVLGAWLAAAGRRDAVVGGVLAGIAAQAVEILVRTGAGSAPDAWFNGRLLEGPVGYHNAQALLCAVGLPLAVWAASAVRLPVRVAGGAAAAPLLAVLVLTQSRAALATAGIAVAAQVALSRRLRTAAVAIALVGAGAVLALELRSVDRALLTDGLAGATGSLRAFALVTAALAAGVAIVAALASPRRRPRLHRRFLLVAAVAALAAVAAAAALLGPALAPRVHAFVSVLVTDAPPASAPGTTRFAAISLDGRREAWRVAANAIREHPLTGDGAGGYSIRWGVERRLPQLYILQPHSLELELGAELGVPGLLLFAVFVCAVAVALRGGLHADRAAAAAGVAVFVALVVQTGVDWTWSFAGILAPSFLVVGAVAAPAAGARARAFRPMVLAAAAVALVAIAVPYVAAEELARGSTAPTAAAALRHTQAALMLDPWNAAAVSAEGRVLEGEGRFREAAARYVEAAHLSRRPWLEWFRSARALQRAGATPQRVEACLLAQRADPAENALHSGPCGWPWLALHHPGTWPPGPDGPTRPWSPRG